MFDSLLQYSTPTLEELIKLSHEEDTGRLTRDVWRSVLKKIHAQHPKKICCIKIDPMQKHVSVESLDLVIEEDVEDDDWSTLDISPPSGALEHLSEIPDGGMLRTSKAAPLGDLLKWTDLDLMEGGLEQNRYPGFKLSQDAKTLTGKALVVKILTHNTKFGAIRVFDNTSEEDLAFVTKHIRWFSSSDAQEMMDNEYKESCAELLQAQKDGKLGNTRIITMR